MFDKISEAAERVATNVSRRAFLGRLGKGALATAGVLGGVLAFASEAKAGTCTQPWHCQFGAICCCGQCVYPRRGFRCPRPCP
jgi:hypothetical protein